MSSSRSRISNLSPQLHRRTIAPSSLELLKPGTALARAALGRTTLACFGLSCFGLAWFGLAWFAWAQSPLENARSLPPGKLGEVILLGQEVVSKTTSHPLSRAYSGNALQCTSCHLDNGTHPTAGTFLRTATAYPAWSAREGRVITLEDRVLNCFMRSCNGVRPPLGSEVSVAVTTYITWLSDGQPMKMNDQKPIGPGKIPALAIEPGSADVANGRRLYDRRCAECHQADGQGDSDNPPVWGDASYNDGAGLAQVGNLAAWLKVAMPLDDANLSDQEALDIAAFVNSHTRPHFDLKAHLPDPSQLGQYNGRTE